MVDYRLEGRQILMIGPNIPQIGEILTAVYSPASQKEIKATDRSFASGELGATTRGDFPDTALREALALESRTAIATPSSQEGAEASRALRMLEDQHSEGRSRPTPRGANADFDGLGDGLVSSPTVRWVAQEAAPPRVQFRDRGESKALEMLNHRLARDLSGAPSSLEARNPFNR
jgi:hypothetical protein